MQYALNDRIRCIASYLYKCTTAFVYIMRHTVLMTGDIQDVEYIS